MVKMPAATGLGSNNKTGNLPKVDRIGSDKSMAFIELPHQGWEEQTEPILDVFCVTKDQWHAVRIEQCAAGKHHEITDLLHRNHHHDAINRLRNRFGMSWESVHCRDEIDRKSEIQHQTQVGVFHKSG